MCKKALVIGLLAVGALYVYKRTPVGSYVCTWWNRNCPSAEVVSRDFQLDRVRNEIDKLDEEVRALLDPIADKQERADRLEQEIKTTRTRLAERRDGLRELMQGVEAGTQTISYEGKELTLTAARARLERENAALQLLKSREEELRQLQTVLQGDLAQLDRIAGLKQQLKARLAKLSVQEQTLQTKQNVTPAGLNQNRVRDIQRTLDRIEQAQKKEVRRIELESRYDLRPNAGTATAPAANLNELKAFVGPPAPQTSLSSN